MNVLVLNAGSSTLKCAIYHLEGKSALPQEPLCRGILDWDTREKEAVDKFLAAAWSGSSKALNGPEDLAVVGHRVVHGGEKFSRPTLITPEVKETIRDLCALAPLHNPANLQGIELIEKILPNIPQAAVFDTAYHATIGEAAATYPGPYAWREQGIIRYGFHGISHQYCAERAAQLLTRKLTSLKIVTCHLGNGSSLAATKKGRCVDTTMGFTPMEGLMMGTRCGSIDPGIILHLLREQNISPNDLDNLLNSESGLKGICGDSDMRAILERITRGDKRAKLAFSMFVHRLKTYIGAMAATMGGIDVLVFTAGIGENASRVRAEACQGLKYLGVVIDPHKNAHCKPDQDVSAENSRVPIVVIHTREEWAIAQVCQLFLG